jgi:hypothetical protein
MEQPQMGADGGHSIKRTGAIAIADTPVGNSIKGRHIVFCINP